MFVTKLNPNFTIGWLFSVTFCCLVASGCQQSEPTADPVSASNKESSTETGTVTFQFNFGDGRVETVVVDEVSPGQTVLDCLQKIEQPKVVVNGSGQNAFVSSIGELTTAAGEGWSYSVNDQWADRSVGVYEVEAGDEVTWTYGGFEFGN